MQIAFLIQDFVENKNGRLPECIEAVKKHGVTKNGRWLYIDKERLPEICGQFNPLKNKQSGGCSGCGSSNPPVEKLPNQLEEELKNEGIQLGTLIENIAKGFGIESCPPCKARKIILNNIKSLGWKEAVKQFKETFKDDDGK